MLERDGLKFRKPGADDVSALGNHLLYDALPKRALNYRHENNPLGARIAQTTTQSESGNITDTAQTQPPSMAMNRASLTTTTSVTTTTLTTRNRIYCQFADLSKRKSHILFSFAF
jgi:hypothetical protein